MPRRKRTARRNSPKGKTLNITTMAGYSAFVKELQNQNVEDEAKQLAIYKEVESRSKDGMIAQSAMVNIIRAARAADPRKRGTERQELLDEQKTAAIPDEVDVFAEAIEAFADSLDIDSGYLEAMRTSNKAITRSDREAAAFGIGRYDVHTIARAALFGRQITDDTGAVDTDALDAAMRLSTAALDSSDA